MQAYKYLEARYLDEMRQGIIYVNTFRNIARIEGQGLIGDKNEAFVRNYFGNLDVTAGDPNAAEQIAQLADAGIIVTGGARAVFTNSGQYEARMKDAHLYSATLVRNDQYWFEEENRDVCVSIKDFKEFFYRLARPLQNLRTHEYADLRECIYEDNVGSIAEGTYKYPHYWRKLPRFEHQAEARIVLRPWGDTLLVPYKINIEVDDLIEVVSVKST